MRSLQDFLSLKSSRRSTSRGAPCSAPLGSGPCSSGPPWARANRASARAACFFLLHAFCRACFLAGFSVAALTGSIIAVRLLLAAQPAAFLAWLAGALFLPSLALASGIVSGTGKVFEALLTVLWYIGPMNHTPGLDFTGAANGHLATHYTIVYTTLTAALLAFAFFTRARQLRSN